MALSHGQYQNRLKPVAHDYASGVEILQKYPKGTSKQPKRGIRRPLTNSRGLSDHSSHHDLPARDSR